MHRVSVVIPTYNRLSRLKSVLTALERQTVPLDEFEVIVVCDGATDGTPEYLESLVTPLRFTAVIQPNGGPASARNNGVGHATGELVLFIDDDVVADKRLVAEHLHCHDQSSKDLVVIGPMLTPDDFQMAPWVRWEQDRLAEQYESMEQGLWLPTARQFYTGNSSLSRSAINAVGGFDARFRRAEDVELAYRLAESGINFKFNPNAIGYHYAERSFQSWVATPYEYGRNDVVFANEGGQLWLSEVAAREYQERHVLIRYMVRCCLCRKVASKVVIGLLGFIGQASNALGFNRAAQQAYSGLFNLRYYQGVADGLGGCEKFWAKFS
ncbi:MAG: glycosyltransferase family 2 protein [Hyphomicrobiaceae bacterium]|nr:glycosyltransferase family 2 protein [Hyphomicrobiaceae bacterium]MCC0011218.1 glycosyltransferase family 2 protein [Hyphomicrobiaceae bacterium]